MANSILRLARLPQGQTPPLMGSSREGGHEMHSVRTVTREKESIVSVNCETYLTGHL